jgi:hypothetical protein
MPSSRDRFKQSFFPFAGISLACVITLSGCAGAIFGGSVPRQAKDLEELTTRHATPDEEKRLDRCLYQVFRNQKAHHAKTGKYIDSPRKLRAEKQCGKLKLSLERKSSGYVAMARLRDGDSVVRWTVDERGEVVEHNDSNMEITEF